MLSLRGGLIVRKILPSEEKVRGYISNRLYYLWQTFVYLSNERFCDYLSEINSNNEWPFVRFSPFTTFEMTQVAILRLPHPDFQIMGRKDWTTF